MEIYTIGFTKKTAEQFFTILRTAGIKRVVDIRLNNSSQLAGFSKQDDLRFFLREICQAEYIHVPLLAPTQELLDSIKKSGVDWQDYERRFSALMAERRIEYQIERSYFDRATVLLCSEATPEHCHRRLVAEYLQRKWGDIHITHL
jgi:uncharacterized protein (DUF488 family)